MCRIRGSHAAGIESHIPMIPWHCCNTTTTHHHHHFHHRHIHAASARHNNHSECDDGYDKVEDDGHTMMMAAVTVQVIVPFFLG